ncbi:MAG: hypothetical protein ACTSWN_05800, partial [Promethearchaeota archaeon]
YLKVLINNDPIFNLQQFNFKSRQIFSFLFFIVNIWVLNETSELLSIRNHAIQLKNKPAL